MGWFKKLRQQTHDYRWSHLPGKKNKVSISGYYMRGEDEKKAAAKTAEAQKQTQIDLLTAQQNAATNALADLSLENTPDIVAGGTAAALMGVSARKRRKTGDKQSIATQLGIL